MLTVDTATPFLLQHGLIDESAIIDGALCIDDMARRNRNLRIQGPSGTGYVLKQSDPATTGGQETLRSEAAIYLLCQHEPRLVAIAPLMPRLAYCDLATPLLVVELLRDSLPLWQCYTASGTVGFTIEAAHALGKALATVHTSFTSIDPLHNPGMRALGRGQPWVMMVHKPSPELLTTLTPTDYQILQILQTKENLSKHLDYLRTLWRPSTIIHGDIKSDNVLGIRLKSTALAIYLVDWELAQIGDPAWDLAAALQDAIMFWVYSMPLSAGATADEMVQKASYPLEKIQLGLRAMWDSYRTSASLASTEAADLLSRAIAFSGGRLVQRAYELAHGSLALPASSVLLLQCASNILNDPESAQIHLYGMPAGRHAL